MTLIPVKGQSGFFRDSETGAIINNNSNDYDTYVSNRDKLLSEKERIDKLESDIGDIKRMLQLTNKWLIIQSLLILTPRKHMGLI